MPASFRCSGATGQAATTSFFGAIPDRFNLLVPAHEPVITVTDMHSANNVNQWTLYNTSFNGGANALTVGLGGTTTAPDGTNTAQKIVETTTNSLHYLTAAPPTTYNPPIDLRLAVFAKAAERTRIVLAIGEFIYGPPFNNTGPFTGKGARAVFDLANGVVGPVLVSDSSILGGFGPELWSMATPTILPFGNGWYCCMIDVTAGRISSFNFLMAFCYIDAGSGVAAENTTYTGTAGSGVYTWRSTLLPPGAWSMSGQREYFEDFNDPTMANIDLANSGAQGFSWYLRGVWPCPGFGPGNSYSKLPITATDATFVTYPALTVYPVGHLSVSGSVLTVGTNDGAIGVASACWDGASGYHGNAFRLTPGLVEWRAKWGQSFETTSLWTESLTTMLQSVRAVGMLWAEMDWLETSFNNPQAALQGMTENTAASGLNTQAGYNVWKTGIFYAHNQSAHFNGVLYTAIIDNTGFQPDISPTQWRLYTTADAPSGGTTGNYPIPSPILFDLEQFNTYSFLQVPYHNRRPGCVLSFMNGVPTEISNKSPAEPTMVPYSPNNGTGSLSGIGDGGASTTRQWYLQDSYLYVLIMANYSAGNTLYVDWVSISR